MATKRTLSVTQLDLDITNPRAKTEENQTDALRGLLAVERDGEKVYELARDICDVGMLDPGDRLYVVPSGTKDRFTVLDGNRRLAALRLLSQTGLIEREDVGITPSLKNRIKRLQTEFADRWPTEVDVVVFEDREEAQHFIRLRHTGENLGAGRSAWSALQIARFDNTGLWQCLEGLRAARELSLAVLNELDRSAFNITSFDRVVSSEEFQRRFGCSIGKNTFVAGDNAPRALKALARVANEVSTGRVHSRGEFAEAETMLPYINEVEGAVNAQLVQIAPTAQGGNVSPLPIKTSPSRTSISATGSQATIAPIAPSHAGAAATVSTLPPIRKKRVLKFLLGKHELTSVTNLKCREIVNELKLKVAVQAAPYGCALLLRCLQELTAEIYVSTVMNQKSTDRSANIDAAAKHLLGNQHPTDTGDKSDIAKNFMQFRQSYEELCSAAHSKVTDLSADHLRSTWNNLGGGIELLWRRIHAAELARSQKVTTQQ